MTGRRSWSSEGEEAVAQSQCHPCLRASAMLDARELTARGLQKLLLLGRLRPSFERLWKKGSNFDAPMTTGEVWKYFGVCSPR